MATTTKRRVTRLGPKHRMWITLEQDTFEALQARGETEGYSISALANLAINRGVTAGLLEDASPTINEQYRQLAEELHRLLKDQIEILQDRIDLKDREIARQHQDICKYETALYGPYKGDQAWRDEQARVTDVDEEK